MLPGKEVVFSEIRRCGKDQIEEAYNEARHAMSIKLQLHGGVAIEEYPVYSIVSDYTGLSARWDVGWIVIAIIPSPVENESSSPT